MRNYSIAALVTVSLGCVGACGGTSIDDDGFGSGNAAGMGGSTAGSGTTTGGAGTTTGGSGTTTGGAGNTTGGKATGGAGVTGGTSNTSGGAGAANTGGSASAGAGNAAGTSTGGVSAIAGAGGASTTGGATTAGTSSTGGVSNAAGSSSDGGMAGMDNTGGTDGGMAGMDTGGMAGMDTGGTDGGMAGMGNAGGMATGGSGGSSPGPACAVADEGYPLNLTCAGSSVVTAIAFASYGTPTGTCGDYETSNCDSATSFSEVEAACLGQNSCTVAATNGVFGDPCVGTYKRLYVEATCSNCGNGALDSGEACDDGVNDGLLCNSDCSVGPELAQILLHCNYGSEVINSLAGTECIVVGGGGASFITFFSPEVEVTLYSNADCTGNTKTVSTDINFCNDSFDQGGGLNDQVRSVRVSRF